MKIIKGLAILGLMTNVAFATTAPMNQSEFKKAKDHFITGTFKGQTDNNKACTVTVSIEREPTGSETLKAKMFFYNYKNELNDSTITLNTKIDDLDFNIEEEEENFKDVSLSKSKIVHQEEDYQVTHLESVSQWITDGKVEAVKFYWAELDYENDPHEDQIICNF